MKSLTGFLLLFLLAACSPGAAAPPPTDTLTPAPGAVALLATPKPLPTPASMDTAANFEDLTVQIGGVEINDRYKTSFGPVRDSTPGLEFLWVQVLLENNGQAAIDLPGEDHFSVLHGGREYKPTYGHRDGYPDYTSLGGTVYPGSPLEGWLRFDIPEEAALDDIQFAFLPESTRITFTRTQSGGSYYNHPVYLWRLESQ